MKGLQASVPGRHGVCCRFYEQPPVTVRRQVWTQAVRRMATKCMQQGTTPSTPRELVDWARQRFYQEASKPEERITLAKACMLIALEEEAAAALQADQMDIRQSLSLGIPDPLTFAPTGRRRNTSRELGSVSTWSLDRLDALAAEASALFQHRSRLGGAPRELPSQAMGLQPKPNRKASASSLMSAEQPDTSKSSLPPSTEFEEATRTGSRKGSAGRKGKVGQEAGGMEESSNKKRGSRRGPAKSGKLQAASSQDAQLQGSEEHTALQREETKAPGKPALMPKPAKQQRAAVAQRGVKGAAASRRSSAPAALKGSISPRQHIPKNGASIACSSAAPSCSLGDAAVCQFPMHALTAINDVLYGRHGYRRPELHGDPRDAQLSHVLERGSGSSAALAILYMEVAQRMGLRMAARLLDGGRYVVIWPMDAPLRTCGQHFVVDAYSQGALFLMDEIAHTFEVKGPSSSVLQPASKRELLAALLSMLRDTSWARAVGCPAEPAFMLPITCATALKRNILTSQLSAMDMERAVAAEERRAFLFPHCRQTQERLALLYYFSAHYQDALEEVEMILAADADASQELRLFRHKLLLWKALESSSD